MVLHQEAGTAEFIDMQEQSNGLNGGAGGQLDPSSTLTFDESHIGSNAISVDVAWYITACDRIFAPLGEVLPLKLMLFGLYA